MAIFGPQGIRDSVCKSYKKHFEMYCKEAQPPEGISAHHAALHGTLVLRYAFAYKPVPEAIVWLELGPLLTLAEDQALQALAEYVVYKERPANAKMSLLKDLVNRGMANLNAEDQAFFYSAALDYQFSWRKIWSPGNELSRAPIS